MAADGLGGMADATFEKEEIREKLLGAMLEMDSFLATSAGSGNCCGARSGGITGAGG